MKTCKTCVYWDQVKSDFDKGYHGENSGECLSDKFEYGGGKIGDDRLVYWDYEGYSAGFMTGGNFGCIHHKEKK